MERQPIIHDQCIIRQQARARRPLPHDTITLRKPKALPTPPARPTMLTMLPMLAMALATGGISFFLASGTSGATRALVTVVPMSLMALMTTGIQQFNYRRALKAHQAQVDEQMQIYRNQVTRAADALEEYAGQQYAILWEENPSLDDLIKRARMRAPTLWERQPPDDDFLAARLGTGSLPICVDIKVQENEDEDPRYKRALEIADGWRQVPDLPITANLYRLGSLGIQGGRIDSLYLAFTIIANLVVHHSPDDVHLYVISHRADAADLWAWARWLPHTDALRGSSTRISLSRETDEAILDELSQLLRQRSDRHKGSDKRRGQSGPYLVVVFDQAPELLSHKVVEMLMQHEPSDEHNALGAAGLFIDAPIPPQVNAIVSTNGNAMTYRETWMSSADQVRITGQPELATARHMDRLARSLAPLRTEISLTAGKGSLPGNVRLVDLLGFTDPRQVPLANLYTEEYDARQVMTFPIGLNVDLKPMMIKTRDTNLGGFGSHAMLAGTTGTGKSVMLQAMVLSLALTHPPTHVNFVLADFKGGASELAKLQDLPHVVGYVSDLDAPLVERFRIALDSEMVRRQILFDRSKEVSGTAVANIRSYNLLHPEDPLPHLMIILDEFAHGRKINPMLQKAMDTIAAQGRALGVHLVLSTQRATDFDQNLRGNISLRISLRVANQEESKAIFNRPEAFTTLTRPGQAFLQVGDNETWEMFQCARADMAFHTDQTRTIELLDDFAVYRLGPDGRSQTLYMHQAQKERPVERAVESEAEVLVEQVRAYCDEHYKPARIICLPPLPEADYLPLLPLLSRLSTYSQWEQGIWSAPELDQRLELPMGMLDLPAQQDQRPYILNLNERDGNLAVIGPAGSGKLMFLQSLLLGLATTHSPDDAHLYVVAQSAALSVFREAPHCGGVIQVTEAERVRRLMQFLRETVNSRHRALGQARVADMATLRTQTNEAYPAIVVVFEDFPGFRADYQTEVDSIIKLAGSAKSVDIHFVFGGPSLSGFHKNLQDNLRNRVALGAADYMEVHQMRGSPLPELKGRGYVSVNQELVECQVASPARQAGIAPESNKATEEILQFLQLMNTSWTGDRPTVIETLPSHLSLADLWQEAEVATRKQALPTAPIGMDYEELQPITLELRRFERESFVLGPPRSGKSEYLMTVALAAAKAWGPDDLEIIIIALRPNQLHHLHALPHVRLATTATEAAAVLQETVDALLLRQASNDGALANKQLLILIDDALRIARDDKLPGLIDQCLANVEDNNINVIISDTGANLAQMKMQLGTRAFVVNAYRSACGVVFSLDQNDLSPLNLQYKLKRPFLEIHERQIGRGRGIFSQSEGFRVIQYATPGTAEGGEEEYISAVNEMVAQINSQWVAAAPQGLTSQEE